MDGPGQARISERSSPGTTSPLLQPWDSNPGWSLPVIGGLSSQKMGWLYIEHASNMLQTCLIPPRSSMLLPMISPMLDGQPPCFVKGPLDPGTHPMTLLSGHWGAPSAALAVPGAQQPARGRSFGWLWLCWGLDGKSCGVSNNWS